MAADFKSSFQVNNFGVIPEDRPETYTRDEAESQCRINFGPEFNLATFADQNELDTVIQILNNNGVNYHAYWTGYTDYDGDLQGKNNPKKNLKLWILEKLAETAQWYALVIS